MTLAFTFGPWGGVDLWWGFSKSLTLGWLTVTFLPVDFDCLLETIFMPDPAIITALLNVADCAAAIVETAYHDDTEDATIGEKDYIALRNALTVLEALEAAAKEDISA